MKEKPYKAVFVAVHADGTRAMNYGTGTRVYTQKHNAVARCPKGGRVIKYDLKDGEVVYEEVAK
jgi:hypothetical protein